MSHDDVVKKTDVVSYADENTQFSTGCSKLEVIHEIKSATESLILWFQNNCMKMNPDKVSLLLSDKKNHQVFTCNEKLSSTYSKNLLGIKTDNNLTFQKHIEELRK